MRGATMCVWCCIFHKDLQVRPLNIPATSRAGCCDCECGVVFYIKMSVCCYSRMNTPMTYFSPPCSEGTVTNGTAALVDGADARVEVLTQQVARLQRALDVDAAAQIADLKVCLRTRPLVRDIVKFTVKFPVCEDSSVTAYGHTAFSTVI